MSDTTGPGIEPRPVRILYAEDDPASIVQVRGILQPDGYKIEPVGSGQEFLEACDTRPPDLALLDLTLPDGSGLDFLRTAHQNHPDLPILIITASDSIRDAVAAIKYGAVDFLTKPLDAQRLSVSIRNSLQLRHQKEEIERLKVATGEAASNASIDNILRELILQGGSDLHLKIGRPPLLRVSSDLNRGPGRRSRRRTCTRSCGPSWAARDSASCRRNSRSTPPTNWRGWRASA